MSNPSLDGDSAEVVALQLFYEMLRINPLVSAGPDGVNERLALFARILAVVKGQPA